MQNDKVKSERLPTPPSRMAEGETTRKDGLKYQSDTGERRVNGKLGLVQADKRNKKVVELNKVDKQTDKNGNKHEDGSTWYRAKEIKRMKIVAGKALYLVVWEESCAPSWVERKDVSPALLQHFHIKYNRQGRVRRVFKPKVRK